MNTVSKYVLLTLVCGTTIPFAAQAADGGTTSNAELLKKIEMLSNEIDTLKQQVKTNQESYVQYVAKTDEKAAKTDEKLDDIDYKVKKTDEKQITRWLTLGGDYRFRVDSLAGKTQPFTDVNATFANAQNQLQSAFWTASAAGDGSSVAQQIAGFNSFKSQMMGVGTYQQAQAFMASSATQQMLGAMGSYATQVPSYKPSNSTLYTNRFGLDLHAKATEDVTITSRLVAYKMFGAQDDAAVANGSSAPYFSDRTGVFDGTVGHVPSNSYLDVDRAYATWSNIGDEPVWFSVGRRPSTNGAPSNLRLNNPRPGNGGTPSLLVDYAFDGMTLGYAPDIDALPGAYAKICYGRGYESGFRDTPTNDLKDTDMIGIAVLPVDTDKLRVWTQWNRGMNIFDAPKMTDTYFGNTAPSTNLGDIDWFGAGAMSTLKKVGPGDLNLFADFATSITHPNDNVSAQFGFQGLLTGAFFNPEAPTDRTGWATAIGARYDLPSKTKIGLEYNHGSKDWITFAPAADDMWTSKVGTRGNVYEAYVIQELNAKPVSSFFSKTFFRLGVQYYDFQYTGSNNWVGAPVKISDVNGQMMTTTPLKNAYDIYATFEVKF